MKVDKRMMSDARSVEMLKAEWDSVFSQGAILAELPIEKWLDDIERAESIGGIMDPTLYRRYIYSGKGEVIKDVLNGALAFKQAILKARVEDFM